MNTPKKFDDYDIDSFIADGEDSIFSKLSPSYLSRLRLKLKLTPEEFDKFFDLPPGTTLWWSCVGTPPIQ